MFWFNRQASKEDIERYSLMLKHMAMEDKCNDYDRLKMMRDFAQDKNFTTKQIGEAQRKACNQIWDEIMEDGLVSEEEQSKFQCFLTLCNQLSEGEVARWNKKMSSNLNLYNITVKNILPVCDSRDVNIVFKKGEILHYASYADVMKTKTVTKSINYSGPSASIRICKGVRYRVGSINVSRKTESFKTSEACGIFLDNKSTCRLFWHRQKLLCALLIKSMLFLVDALVCKYIRKGAQILIYCICQTTKNHALYCQILSIKCKESVS